MNSFLWISQSCLALVFLTAGGRKVFQPGTKLLGSPLYDRVPLSFKRLLGALEIGGAIGITMPLLLNIYPVITIAAAICMTVVLVGAIIVEFQLKKYKTAALITLFLTLAITVAYLRLKEA